MAAIVRRGARVEVQLDRGEREVLLDIIDSLAPHLGSVERTVPRAYDDEKLDEEYARFMRPEVEASREADIEVMRESLRGERDRWQLDESQALSWTRALNHLRLVAGGMLGVEEDGWDAAPDDSLLRRGEFQMLMALGWVQEALVGALDGEA